MYSDVSCECLCGSSKMQSVCTVHMYMECIMYSAYCTVHIALCTVHTVL